ncbi:MAG: DNA-binding response regulator [Actinobacteria bacterium 13_2_20CM_2_71_6]|nr:MAG: DNA-binding response regulator [Actinobacteria bacterium 13_2_20CM_2_71_6]
MRSEADPLPLLSDHLPPDRPIRVLIVDDHALLRDGLRGILEAENDIVVVGEAGNSEQAVAYVAATTPDIVVLDVDIPGDKVTATLTRIQLRSARTKAIILSIYDEPMVVQELLAMGVRGYLLKSVNRQDFVAAIRGVYQDDQRVVLSISQQSLQQVNGARVNLLSDREREVIMLVAGAMSNAQIATRLRITEGTVKRHLRNIFTKLGAVSRIDAVNKAAAAHQLPSRKS